MTSFLKFRLLLWKNFLIQLRKPISTAFEIGLPTLLSLVLMLLRLRVESTQYDNPTVWPPCPYERLNHQFANKTIAFSPSNTATQNVMKTVSKHFNMSIKGFSNEDYMASFITSVVKDHGKMINNSDIYLAGIAFENAFRQVDGSIKFPKHISYKIRLSYAPRLSSQSQGLQKSNSWRTRFKFPAFQTIGPREKLYVCSTSPAYNREGFLALQTAVNLGLMKEMLNEEQYRQYQSTHVTLRRHPYPPYKDDKYVLVLQQQFPMVILLSLIVIVLGIVRDIVLEKERRLKESMKMMGIPNWLHWLAWFTKHFLFLLISIGIMSLFYCVTLDSEKGPVVSASNPVILILFFICYALATISYCFAASVFFKKANTGAAIGGIIFFCMYIPYFFLQERYETMSLNSKILACIDFQVAMAFGGTLLGKFEGIGTGIQFDTLAQGPSVDDSFSMLIVLVMMLADSVVHFLIAWYVEAVFPGEFGVPQPWYFPFMPSYWGCGRKEVAPEISGINFNVYQDQEMFEKEPNEHAGIQIRNLRKVFGRGESKKVAVAGMTLNIYEGQITALLGHNGAGKTTTMSMLTGFYPSTSGTAIIDGYDINTEIDKVRESLGLCPQHDILFDNLTVEEHMIFFGLLKGVRKADILPQCREMLEDMQLLPKLKSLSKTLSGGMKRKLSVCIALIGDSKVVFLDEPSSGLDPNARRNIWTVLQKNRAGRTMVLSTHFMDEADLLGDRIAIMADGVIKCCGSSLFLKKKYGAGYHMVVVKETKCDGEKIISLVKSHIPQADVESNVGAELSFILPQECVGSFEQLFASLESKQQELGISSYGASVTTMEEVFLKVGEDTDSEIKLRLRKKTRTAIKNEEEVGSDATSCVEGASNMSVSHIPTSPSNMPDSPSNMLYSSSNSQINSNHTDRIITSDTENLALDLHEDWHPDVYDFSGSVEKNSGYLLYLQQFRAMFMKRVIHTLRNKLVTITQLVVPLFFTIMGIITVKTLPSFTSEPSLQLTADSYGSNFIPFANASPMAANIANSYARQFDKYPSITTVNVDQDLQSENMMKYLIHQGEKSIGTYNLKYLFAAEYNKSSSSGFDVVAYFNNQAYHSIAISLAAAFNGIFQYLINSTDYSIKTYNYPLPRLPANKFNDEVGFKDPEGFIIGFDLAFGMAFLASSFVLFLVKERDTRAKHVQFVSGVHPLNFWFSTLCWDLINYMLPSIVMIFVFLISSITEYTDDFHWLEILLFFFLYGWSMLPYMYLFSFAFDVPATAYVWITMFNILTGVATMLVVIIFEIPEIDLQNVSEILEWIFMAIFPNFSLSQGLFKFYQNKQNIDICAEFAKDYPFLVQPNKCCLNDYCLYFNNNYLGWQKNGIGRMLFFLSLQGVVLWFFIFSIEFGWFGKIKNLFTNKTRTHRLSSFSEREREMVQEDDDVASERARIANSDKEELLREKVLLDSLTKYYGNFKAVDRISLGIPSRECFGLLGINGAGKTSTFKMLTGDISISSGEAYLNAFSLKTHKDTARRSLGYCPQFDALIGQLTGVETLTLFARLRGIKEPQISGIVSRVIHALTLEPYADKQCQTYSGGNKRKLSTAIALIGDPDIIFLDEPTTGMDPMARRMLWEVLSNVRDQGKTLVLTSHSMEECEALCTRLAIMVNGQFKCLGSIQHLKNKFGEGYTFNAKISFPEDGSSPDLQPLKEFMESNFPNSKLTDVHENMVNYHITDASLSWSEIFGKIECAREELRIEDYLVSQTSLEQVFINFARMQDNPESLSIRQRSMERGSAHQSPPQASVTVSMQEVSAHQSSPQASVTCKEGMGPK